MHDVISAARAACAPSRPRLAGLLLTIGCLLLAQAAPVLALPFTFTDVTAAAGVSYVHGYATSTATDPRAECGGVAAGDYDRDGFVDLYAIHGDVGPNLLFHNEGDGSFSEVGAAAGVAVTHLGCSATFADWDGDGWLDLLVLGFEFGPSYLFRNRGDGTFEDVTASAGLTLTRENNISASFGDYDHDRDLDVFITHWQDPPGASTPAEHLWQNDGDGTFTHASPGSGVVVTVPPAPANSDYTFTPNWVDIDSDGWLDLLVSSDFDTSMVFHNDGDGTFTDITDPAVITDDNGMGSAIGDYDHDGDLDWFVTSIFFGPDTNDGNRFYRNAGDGTFTDVTTATGVRDGQWGWGATFGDFDNDGNPDLYHVNGFHDAIQPAYAPFVTDPSRLFMANGDGTFTEEAAARGVADTARGLGVVAFDYDRDGDLDLFVTNNATTPRLFRNDGGNASNHLTVKVAGLAPNTEGIGARIYVTAGGITQLQEMRAGNNYVSQNPAEAHFGLGSATTADTVVVRWPEGGETTLTSVAANQLLTVTQSASNLCGDGVVETGATYAEECDLGPANGDATSCCQANCTFRPAGRGCRASTGVCDFAEVCTGASGLCPADTFAPSTQVCRPAAGPCDLPDHCTGSTAPCTGDGKSTGLCRPAAGACDVADYCNGISNNCLGDAVEPPGTVCRPSAGTCDVEETCDGTGPECPADTLVAGGTECRAAAGVCDVAESCTGLAPACPADLKSTAVCRPGIDACDHVEVCNGIDDACPPDTLSPPGTVCRPSAGICDPVETCTGSSVFCPLDGKSTSVCRPAAGLCDAAESCDGIADGCPADVLVPSGTICRGAMGACDVAESCTGASVACPQDAKSTAVCRPASDACDLAESCDGLGNECPPDALAPAGTQCRDAAGPCDPAETCSGLSALCPVDAKSTGECRPAAGPCDLPETCDGVGDACPADVIAPSGTECRPAAGTCDVAEQCDGLGAACPADVVVAAGTECRAAAGECDVGEACTGANGVCPPDGKSTQVCRAATGPCDLAESCDGVGNACPADVLAPNGLECRPAAGPCDAAESCTGASIACPTDAKRTDVCRPAADVCDVAESCTGASDTCPPDQFAPVGTACRAAAGPCDVAESCTGAGAACPHDDFAATGTACRTATGACDLAETCTGTGPACPADAKSTAECRPAAGPCDVAETCSGASDDCPPDGFAAAGTECRAAAGVCDLAETCTGSAIACPTDVKSTAVCRPAAAVCDVAEHCDGSGDGCPADDFAAPGTACRPSAGECDVAESCTGFGAACPPDTKSTGVCRPAAGACDLAESCNGLADDCPDDAFLPAGLECRAAAEACDLPEQCTGSAAACPADSGLPDGDADGTCDALDLCPEVSDPAQLDADGDGYGDACDLCTNAPPAVAEKPLLQVSGSFSGAGTDKLKLKAIFEMPTSVFPGVDPSSDGVRLVVSPDAVPEVGIVDVTIPPGLYDPLTREGWTVGGRGTAFSWRSAPGLQGIVKVQLKGKTSDPTFLKVVVKGKRGDYPVDVAALPLRVTLVLTPPAGGAGTCAEIAFTGPPPAPVCLFSGSGKRLKCR